MAGVRAGSWACVVGLALFAASSSLALAEPGGENRAAVRAAYAAAAALQNREQWDLAAEEWQSLETSFANDPLAAKAAFYRGICLLKLDEPRQATNAFAAAIKAVEAIDAADRKREGLDETLLQSRWELGRAEFLAGRGGDRGGYERAVKTLGGFLAAAGDDPRVADAISLEAEALWQLGRKKQAIRSWGRLIEQHPDSPRVPQALYARAVGLAEAGRGEEAAAAMRSFAERFPDHGLSDDVAIWRSDLAFDAGKLAQAAELAEAVAARDGPRRIDAIDRVARARWKLRQWPQAAEAYARLARLLPDDEQPAAAVSAATAYLEADQADQARPLLEAAAAAAGLTGDEAALRLAALEQAAERPAEAVDIASGRIERIMREQRAGSPWLPGLMLAKADGLWAIPDRRQQAAKEYERLVKEHPQSAEAVPALAMSAAAAVADGRPAAAVARAEQFAQRVAKAGEGVVSAAMIADVERIRGEAMLAVVGERSKQGDTAEALALCERLVREMPEMPRSERAWYALGGLREAAGRDEAAIEAYRKVVSLAADGPLAADARLAAGWLLEEAGRGEEAVRAWDELVSAAPDSAAAASARLARGDVRYRAGDYAAALDDARAARFPKEDSQARGEAGLLEGLCLLGLDKPAEAAAVFEGILGSNPDFEAADRVLIELGFARLDADDNEAAGKAFRRLVERFPKSPHAAEAWLELGESAYARGDYPRAKAAYASAIESLSDSQGKAGTDEITEQARHKLGWTAFMQDDHAAAAEAFAAQLAASPGGRLAADARAMLGEARHRLGDFKAADAALAAAEGAREKLSSDDLRALVLVRLADTQARGGHFQRSLQLADGLLAQFPDSPYAPQARYARAWALQNLGRLEEAAEAYRLLADGPRSELAVRGRMMEGEVLFEQGKHREAIKTFFKAAYGYGEKAAPPAFHPWQAQATYEAARCFEVLERPDQAARLYEELLERYPDCQQAGLARRRLEQLAGSRREKS